MLTATATCTGYRAVLAGIPQTGAAPACVSGRVLAERVGWLADLVRQMADQVIAGHWSEADLAVLAAGVGLDGRRLPCNGWMAMRRLGWTAAAPAEIVVSDRVRRIAEEEAARLLRAAVRRRAVVAALLATWPADPTSRTVQEWRALRAMLPDGGDAATVRDRTRQVAAFLARERRLPAHFGELEPVPAVARQVSLAAADRQHVVVQRIDGSATVRVRTQLPTCPAPAGYRDWAWHTMDVTLPPTVPPSAAVCSPTLRPSADRVRIDLPWRVPHTPPALIGHTRALGADWGLTTLLTGTVADLHADGQVSADGRPLRFDAAGVLAKLVRLRRHRELLKTKLDHLIRLREGKPDTIDPALAQKLATLDREHAAVCARIRNLNKALAWSAARWLVDHAIAADASVIYLEDLTTLQAGGASRSLNRRLSGHVRGSLLGATRHLAAKAGIAVVTVPARGTSAGCPRCGNPVRHVKAPDRATAGHRWSTCPCGLSTNRDHAAAQRIVARGLASQAATRRDRDGVPTIRRATDVPVQLGRSCTDHKVVAGPKPVPDRRKAGATRKRPRGATTMTPPLLPSRRQDPAPASPSMRAAGQCPAGQQPETTHSGRQVLRTISHTRARRPHRVRATILGHGFHRHVYATPPPVRDGNTGRTPKLLGIR